MLSQKKVNFIFFKWNQMTEAQKEERRERSRKILFKSGTSTRANLKIQINSMYGKMVSSTMIPRKYFRNSFRKLKIEKIFDGR